MQRRLPDSSADPSSRRRPSSVAPDRRQDAWDSDCVLPDCREPLVLLVRVLARQAARDVFERMRTVEAKHPPSETEVP
jgi:hypothetical protein